MSIQSNFPAIKPTLLLDFANTEELDGRITFTRASTATYYGTQTAKAEENLLTNSQTVANYDSVGISTKTNNAAVAPDGTSTAASIIENAAFSEHYLAGPQNSFVSGQDYTLSCFVKPNGRNFFRLSFATTAFPSTERFAYFDVQNGVLGTVAPNITATITSAGNGWYRCSISRAATISASAQMFFVLCEVDNATSYTGDGTSGAFIWGAQLEARSTATAYTPTTTQPITNYIPVLQTAASGVARFDHNPTTFESLGLLIEEQRTNLLTYSEDFSNAAWIKTACSISSNTVVAPNGTLTGDKLVEDTTNASHLITRSVSVTSGTTYTYSLFAKAAERSIIRIATGLAFPSTFVTVSLSDGSVSDGTAVVQQVGNGWWRISLTVTASSTSNAEIYTASRITTGGGSSAYTGNGYSGIFIWGAQLEAGAFATSYIPTVASQVTRAADAASMTGANFSSWYNQAEGTLFSQATCQGIGSGNASVAFSVSDGASNVIRTGWHGGLAGSQPVATQSGMTTNGTSQATIVGGYSSGFNTSAFAYKRNDLAASVNGGAAGTDTDAILPSVASASIGNWTGTQPINGTIKKIAFYPIRCTNAQLQGLTS